METALVNHQQPQFTSPTYSFDNTTMDSANSPPQYLKMEDLQSGSSPSPTSFDNCGTSTQASPPPLIVTSKPAKKRKSWGQELPEPKTTLPPRKRAKTDDEKEQRRIERIKRNRAAAHNSRERKRQEAENLAVLLAVAEAKLEAYAKLHGPLPANTVLREVQVRNDGYDESTQAATRASNNRADTPNSDYSTPAPSLSYSRGSIDAAASPASPADTVISNYPTIKIEPSDLPTTISPPAFEALDPKSGSLSHLDATQHSAVSVEPAQEPDVNSHAHLQQSIFDLSSHFTDNMDNVDGKPLHDPSGLPASDLLPADSAGHLDPFSYENGAYDSGFDDTLGSSNPFSFDDFVNDDAVSFAVDHAAGAA